MIVIAIIVVIVLVVISSIIGGVYYNNKLKTCNNDNCSNLVNIGDWVIDSETITGINFIKKCTNKTNVDGCKQLDSTKYKESVNWSDYTSCDKVCGGGKKNKTLTFNGKTYTSTTTYPCNTENCDDIINFTEWTKDSETDNNITLARTCTNKDPNRNACQLLDNSKYKMTADWSGYTSCDKICGRGEKKKTVTLNNKTYTSTTSYPCNTEDCDDIINFTDWTKDSETDNNIKLTRICTNKDSSRNACQFTSSSDINKNISWTSFTDCNQACNGGTRNKTVTFNDLTYISDKSFTCNTETCSSLVTFDPWVKVFENDNGLIINRICKNTDSSRNACNLLSSSDTSLNITWTGFTTCSKPCDGGIRNKTANYGGVNFISTQEYPCNTERCSSLVNFTEWIKNTETDNFINVTRTCTNKNSTRNACSLIPITDISKNINWTNTTSCSKPCGTSGKNNKTVNFNNKTFTSTQEFPCNRDDCYDLVNFSPWIKIGETDNQVMLKRDCSNKNTNRNACSLIPITDISKNINWSNTTTCNKICDGGLQNKNVNFNNIPFTSTKQFPCNQELCNSLVNFTNWRKVDETTNNVILNRTCSKKNPNTPGDPCSLIPTTDISKTIPWLGSTDCNKVCDGGNYNKTTVFNNQIYQSTRTYPCNTETCSSLVTLGQWAKVSENTNSFIINRTCDNKNTSRNACDLIPKSDISKTIIWSDFTTCDKPCDGGTRYKTGNYNGINYTSNISYPCNTESCSSLVNYSNWQKKSETDNAISFNRTCNNIITNRNACSLIPDTSKNQTINWSGYNSCDKLCGGGNRNKTVTFNGINYSSTNRYPCNIESCNSLVNFGEWNKSTETDRNVTFSRPCTNKDASRNVCGIISNNMTTQTINWSNTTECNKPCNSGIKNKTVVFNGKTFNSNNTSSCNNETCSSLVTFGPWSKISENDNSSIINRPCYNKNTSRNACSLIPKSDISNTIIWSDFTTCDKPCDGGKKYKTGNYNGTNYTSNTSYPCNTDSCSSLINFGPWTLASQNDTYGTLTRTCTNKTNNNTCGLIPISDISKNINWTDITACTGDCNGGIQTKNFVFNGTQYISNPIRCAPPSCIEQFNLPGFGTVKVSTSTPAQYGSLQSLLTSRGYRSPGGYYDCLSPQTAANILTPYNGRDNISTSDINNNIYPGIWIQVEYPTALTIKRYSFNKNNYDEPAEWVLLASNNGWQWRLLDSINSQNIQNSLKSNGFEFLTNNNTPYIFYRFVFSKVKAPCQSTLNLDNLKLLTL